MASISLEQQLKQTTKLSPSQLQVIRLLELPAVDLNQRINEELQDNPALEEGYDEPELKLEDDPNSENEYEQDNESEAESKENETEYDDYSETADAGVANREPYDDFRRSNYTGGTSLFEYLKSQVYLTRLTKPERHIAKWVLGNIDDDGYLRRTTEQLVDDYAFQEGVTIEDEEMERIVEEIKRFDPAGVAAFDLKECLMLQLERISPTTAATNALRIIRLCFEDFSKHHYDAVLNKLGMNEEEMHEAIEVILHLNQKPANAFGGNTADEAHRVTIIPDFYVERQGDELTLTLNTGDIPPLHVSPEYKEMQTRYAADKEAEKFIRKKIEDAATFISAIEQRNTTLMSVMSAILVLQREFFLEGDECYLRPLRLQEVAEKTGYDVSTISRVTDSKYVQTEWGIYSLRHFFSEGMATSDGDEVSTREIKKALADLITNEDKRAPMNDDQLVEEMSKKGYNLARRTIAKYRDQLNIPVARLRKRL